MTSRLLYDICAPGKVAEALLRQAPAEVGQGGQQAQGHRGVDVVGGRRQLTWARHRRFGSSGNPRALGCMVLFWGSPIWVGLWGEPLLACFQREILWIPYLEPNRKNGGGGVVGRIFGSVSTPRVASLKERSRNRRGTFGFDLASSRGGGLWACVKIVFLRVPCCWGG